MSPPARCLRTKGPTAERDRPPPPHSVRKLFDGFATAAFNVWKVTVSIVISNTVIADRIKGNAVNPVL